VHLVQLAALARMYELHELRMCSCCMSLAATDSDSFQHIRGAYTATSSFRAKPTERSGYLWIAAYLGTCLPSASPDPAAHTQELHLQNVTATCLVSHTCSYLGTRLPLA
jgi:phage tail sheath gpL-like